MFRVRHQIQANDTDSIRDKDIAAVVLDSGIAMHPDLKDSVAEFRDFVNGKKEIYDDFGHGTHVCGIIAGNGYASNGRYKGMASQVKLLVGKVLDEKGEGKVINMLQALNWVENMCMQYPICVVNISIGVGSAKNEGLISLLKEQLDRLWDKGIVLVVSVGNGGPQTGSASILAKGDKCISVGCHDGDFYKNYAKRCETFSGRGSYWDKNGPDVVAPGTEIISCNAFYLKRGVRGGAYCPKSGTSMATAIVTGAVIRLLQLHPELSNREVRDLLMKTATDLNEPYEKQGHGMVNVRKLLTEMV